MSLDDKVKIMSIPCILVLTTRRGMSICPQGFGGPGGPPAGAPLPGGPMGPRGGCKLNGDGGSKPNVVFNTDPDMETPLTYLVGKVNIQSYKIKLYHFKPFYIEDPYLAQLWKRYL